jgi:hypothetical protein
MNMRKMTDVGVWEHAAFGPLLALPALLASAATTVGGAVASGAGALGGVLGGGAGAAGAAGATAGIAGSAGALPISAIAGASAGIAAPAAGATAGSILGAAGAGASILGGTATLLQSLKKAPSPPGVPGAPVQPSFSMGLYGGNNTSLSAQSPLLGANSTVTGQFGASTATGKSLLGQ